MAKAYALAMPPRKRMHSWPPWRELAPPAVPRTQRAIKESWPPWRELAPPAVPRGPWESPASPSSSADSFASARSTALALDTPLAARDGEDEEDCTGDDSSYASALSPAPPTLPAQLCAATVAGGARRCRNFAPAGAVVCSAHARAPVAAARVAGMLRALECCAATGVGGACVALALQTYHRWVDAAPAPRPRGLAAYLRGFGACFCLAQKYTEIAAMTLPNLAENFWIGNWRHLAQLEVVVLNALGWHMDPGMRAREAEGGALAPWLPWAVDAAAALWHEHDAAALASAAAAIAAVAARGGGGPCQAVRLAIGAARQRSDVAFHCAASERCCGVCVGCIVARAAGACAPDGGRAPTFAMPNFPDAASQEIAFKRAASRQYKL